ncbi:hypothetical protein [Streptomyces sp. AK04-3B]|uniref:hypothetical protein n=1 Tax=unclassified Streptomyces TaxID=2593676 RepID=UPI0029BB6353|nr:hypothetical protein [Streptomyces sp. AK04-3B]MDX3802048.1 hypothetical protein [Streptomyces sp. AK04-3B]
MTTGPASRAARAAFFAAVCVLTAAVGHTWASGVSPPWFVLGSSLFGTASLAWWVAGRERGAVVVTASTVATQLALHSLFDLLRPGPTVSAAAAEHIELMRRMSRGQLRDHMEHMASMGMKPVDMAATEPGSAGTGSMRMGSMDLMLPGGHGGALMFAAHSLAALVCGLWLWRGESAAFRVGRALAAAVFVPLRLALRTTGVAPRPQAPARPAPAPPARRLRAALLQHAVSRRGPPGHPAPC